MSFMRNRQNNVRYACSELRVIKLEKEARDERRSSSCTTGCRDPGNAYRQIVAKVSITFFGVATALIAFFQMTNKLGLGVPLATNVGMPRLYTVKRSFIMLATRPCNWIVTSVATSLAWIHVRLYPQFRSHYSFCNEKAQACSRGWMTT